MSDIAANPQSPTIPRKMWPRLGAAVVLAGSGYGLHHAAEQLFTLPEPMPATTAVMIEGSPNAVQTTDAVKAPQSEPQQLQGATTHR